MQTIFGKGSAAENKTVRYAINEHTAG